MVKITHGDLILTEDTEFKESIKVFGDIKGYHNLKVAGDIDAWNIDAGNIDAWDIIFCEKRIKKNGRVTTKAKVFIDKRNKLTKKKW